jgi:hypothetical protein
MNRETGEITVESKVWDPVHGGWLDGTRTYTMRFDLNAMCTLEGLFSTPDRPAFLPQLIELMQQGSTTHVRAFVWAALRAYHPDVTLEEAGHVVSSSGGLGGFSGKLQALAKSAQADPADLEQLAGNGADRPPKAPARPRPAPHAPTTGGASTSKPAAAG